MDNDLQNQIQQGIKDYMRESQYSVTQIPYHLHNGVDSPLIPSNMIYGQVQLVSGVATVNNPHISLTSLIFLSNAAASITFGLLYVSYQTAKSFTITSKKPDMSGTQTADVSFINYLIINP